MATTALLDNSTGSTQAAVGQMMVAKASENTTRTLFAALLDDTTSSSKHCIGLDKCWTYGTSQVSTLVMHWRELRYWDDCSLSVSISRPLSDYGTTGFFPMDRAQTQPWSSPLGEFRTDVDASGNLYLYGWNFKQSPAQADSEKNYWEARIRRYNTAGASVQVTVDMRNYTPTDPVNGWPINNSSNSETTLANQSPRIDHIQNLSDRLRIYCRYRWTNPENSAQHDFGYYIVDVDSDMNLTEVGLMRWSDGTLANASFITDPLDQDTVVQGVSEMNSVGQSADMATIDVLGVVANAASSTALGNLPPIEQNPHWWDENDAFYIDGQMFDATFADVTPAWMSAITYLFGPVPNSDASRTIGVEDNGDGTKSYRVRDSSGNIITEVDGDFSGADELEAIQFEGGQDYEAFSHRSMLQPTDDDGYASTDALTGQGTYDSTVFKFPADIILATRKAGWIENSASFNYRTSGSFDDLGNFHIRGQWPSYNYSGWT